MKHLKTYKIFESNSEYDDIISVLNDMSLELKDKGFLVKNNVGVFNENSINIRVFKANDDADIADGGSKRFYFEEIKETILQMVDFMDSEGWFINTIEFVDATGYYTWESLKMLRPSVDIKKSIEELNSFMAYFIIKFEKK